MYKVSVIVPAYNAEKYIEECVNSLLNQTLDSIEIILIDDGSKDKTGFILDEMSKGHENVIVIHQKNQGLYRGREIGLSIASGEYIGWVDADDYVDSTMFQKLYELATSHKSELAYCSHDFVPKKIKTKEKWFHPYNEKKDVDFVEKNCQPWNKIVKRELMERLEIGPKFSRCFDEIYIKIMLVAQNPISIDEALYHYRVNDGTMSSSYANYEHYMKIVDASFSLKEECSDFCADQYWNDYFDYRIEYYYLISALVAANAGNKKAYNELNKKLHSMKYLDNQHFWRLMKRNYGNIKSFVIGRLIPINYLTAKTICRIAL